MAWCSVRRSAVGKRCAARRRLGRRSARPTSPLAGCLPVDLVGVRLHAPRPGRAALSPLARPLSSGSSRHRLVYSALRSVLSE